MPNILARLPESDRETPVEIIVNVDMKSLSTDGSLKQYFVERYRDHVAAQAGDDRAKYLIFSANRHAILKSHDYVGGLADRLKGVYSAFLMAVATGRIFLIDWDTPFALSDNFSPNGYDWRLEPHLKNLGKRSETIHLDMIDKRGIALKETPPDRLEQEIFGNRDSCVLNINWLYDEAYLDFFDLPPSDDEAFRQVFDFLFKPLVPKGLSAEINKLDKMRRSHDALFGVHLRTGGDKDWWDSKLDKRRSYRKLMIAAFDFAAERGSRNPLFYFASDSESAKRSVEKKNWPHDVATIPGPIQHLDRSLDMTRQGSDFTFFEFDLLRRCDGIIGGAGAFYRIAAMAGGKPYITYRD